MEDAIKSWLELGLGVGAFAVLAWLVFHVTRNTIPKMLETFKKTNETQCDTFKQSLAEERTEFLSALRVERERAESERKDWMKMMERHLMPDE